MEQNNLENQIREKLNSREIKPTEMAWDRLDAMLTVAEEKKSKKRFSWLFIAACFLGIMALGTAIYQVNSNEIQIENEVVNQQEKINSNNNNTIIKKEVVIEIEKQQPIVQAIHNLQIVTQNQKQKTIINQKTTKKLENENVIQTNEEIVQVQNLKIQNKEMVTTNTNVAVSAEALLASVDKARKSVKQTKVSVNASSLLSQVDGEINTDYRETRFQKMRRNFETVKVAVANRNNQ